MKETTTSRWTTCIFDALNSGISVSRKPETKTFKTILAGWKLL